MKRIMLLAASALILSCVDARAQMGKQGTQRPRAGTIQNPTSNNRSQPGTWRTTPEQRMNTNMPVNNNEEPGTRPPASTPMKQVSSGTVMNNLQQDTIRRRRDTVEGPVPVPVPPVPPPVPMPDTIQR